MPTPRRTTTALLLLAAAAVGVAILARPDAPEAAPKPPEGDAAKTKGPRDDAGERLLVTVHGRATAGIVRGAPVTARFADGTRRHALTEARGQAAFEPTVPGVAMVWAEAGDLCCAAASWTKAARGCPSGAWTSPTT